MKLSVPEDHTSGVAG